VSLPVTILYLAVIYQGWLILAAGIAIGICLGRWSK
jgi:hypothetical protein